MNLYDKIASYPSLLKGFYRVRENDGVPGWDHVSIEDFEDNIQENIALLYKQLRNRTYKQKPFVMFEAKKQNGKARLISIPCVIDRVAQQSAMSVIEPLVDAELENESYAYRKGFSREGAAQKIISLYNKGFCWLADADIQDFFNNIDHTILISRVKHILDDKDVIELLVKFITPDYYFKNKKYKQTKGLPLGSAISPLLANLYLDKFDEEIKKKNLQLVRFADDFVILTKTKPAAEEAIKISGNLLAGLKLNLNLKKTKVSSFKEGFKYLGYIFLNSLIVPASPKDTTNVFSSFLNDSIDEKTLRSIAAKKEKLKELETGLNSSDVGIAFLEALTKKGITLQQFIDNSSSVKKQDNSQIEREQNIDLTDEPVYDQEIETRSTKTKEIPTSVSITEFKRSLYIHEQGSILSKESGRFVVTKDDIDLLEIPIIKISHIIIFGNCLITPAVYQTCLINRIQIALLSSHGRYYGTIDSYGNRNTELEKLQFLRSLDEAFTLNFAINQVKVKIHNTRVLLQRHNKRIKSPEITSVLNKTKQVLQAIDNTASINYLRGIEGSIASTYFHNLGLLFNADTGFYTKNFVRIKRPPTDPVNSLLSFGYTLLGFNLFSFLDMYGLNPYIGFYHVDRQGHPSLVSDIIEEFRHVIDSLVIYVINKKIIKKNDFYFLKEPSSPCLLNKRGRKEYIRQFEIKMNQVTTHSPSGTKVSYRKCLQL
ncbi:MAG TPA: CRISPR-associated endonuclease Cas1 [Ignavibacteria bacterium]|nr:CRISPR-associated endonuclease Cas1 [Ignavibacteria bacterium]